MIERFGDMLVLVHPGEGVARADRGEADAAVDRFHRHTLERWTTPAVEAL
jgi:hypothetical protein